MMYSTHYLCRERDLDLLLLDLDLDLVRDWVRFFLLSISAGEREKKCWVLSKAQRTFSGKTQENKNYAAEHCNAAFMHSLPGSIAAEMSDWASLTLFMASSISLFDASAFRLALRFKPAAKGFSLNKGILISRLIITRNTPTHLFLYSAI